MKYFSAFTLTFGLIIGVSSSISAQEVAAPATAEATAAPAEAAATTEATTETAATETAATPETEAAPTAPTKPAKKPPYAKLFGSTFGGVTEGSMMVLTLGGGWPSAGYAQLDAFSTKSIAIGVFGEYSPPTLSLNQQINWGIPFRLKLMEKGIFAAGLTLISGGLFMFKSDIETDNYLLPNPNPNFRNRNTDLLQLTFEPVFAMQLQPLPFIRIVGGISIPARFEVSASDKKTKTLWKRMMGKDLTPEQLSTIREGEWKDALGIATGFYLGVEAAITNYFNIYFRGSNIPYLILGSKSTDRLNREGGKLHVGIQWKLIDPPQSESKPAAK